MAKIRLDKFISDRTPVSRSEVRVLIKKGTVRINGTVMKDIGFQLDPETADVTVNGEAVIHRSRTVLALNKPAGYVCSTDGKGGPSVLELVPPDFYNKNLFPVGRLDKDTEGLLLITDDGKFAHSVISPKRHVPKIYLVKLAEKFEVKYVNQMSGGIVLGNGDRCLPARVRVVENLENTVLIEICEGKYHQVKRMFAAADNRVEKLMRISVGGLILSEKLAKGQVMELLHNDVEKIFSPLDLEQVSVNRFV